MITNNINFYNNKTIDLYKIFITDKDSVYINCIGEYGFSYDFIRRSDLKLYNKYSLKDILTIKKDMGVNELYIEVGDCGINNFISLEGAKKIKKECDLHINIFSKKLIGKIYGKEKNAKVNEVLIFLNINDAIQALKIIQYIKLKKILNDFDVCKLYALYSRFLKETAPKFIEYNFFYLERLVLGLISLEEINLTL